MSPFVYKFFFNLQICKRLVFGLLSNICSSVPQGQLFPMHFAWVISQSILEILEVRKWFVAIFSPGYGLPYKSRIFPPGKGQDPSKKISTIFGLLRAVSSSSTNGKAHNNFVKNLWTNATFFLGTIIPPEIRVTQIFGASLPLPMKILPPPCYLRPFLDRSPNL